MMDQRRIYISNSEIIQPNMPECPSRLPVVRVNRERGECVNISVPFPSLEKESIKAEKL